MERIYKYPLSIIDFQVVELPIGAEILSVKIIHDEMFLWARVETDSDLVPRRIRIFGTGNPMDYQHQLKFIDTVTQFNGTLVWHVFENYKEFR